MTNNCIKKELTNRYKYLYENKELILSLCIDKKIRTKYYEEQISKLKKSLVTPRYYLMNDIPNELVTLFENFLFGDYSIENTTLYLLIENIKSDSKKLTDAHNKINGLVERRSHNKFLCNQDCYTVWRILTYVRNKNKDNKAVLDALDRYYNIDRYIGTGINWTSGYYLLDEDVNKNEDYLNSNYNSIIINGVKTKYDYSAIMFFYEGNEFEKEDDYFVCESSIEFDEKPINNNLSLFMFSLNSINMLSEDEKYNLYLELQNELKSNSIQKILKDNN